MLLCAYCASSVIFVPLASNYWVVIALVSMAVAALQGFSANLFTLPTDLFPEGLIGSAMGFGGTFGAIGGMGAAVLAGFILQATGNYILLFKMASSVGFLALLFHLLSPSFAPLEGGHKTGEHE
jgi:MFS transporter, ACS family, hexuronate transporter